MKDNLENNFSNSLFHFTSLKIAVENILPTSKLKLGLLENTNDPRENKSFGFGAKNAHFQVGREIIDHTYWDGKITKLLRNMAKVICFSSDYEIDNEWYDGFNLPRMWAQYGDNHKGICLDIDIELFKQENAKIFEKSILRSIIYESDFEYPWVNYDRIREIGLKAYVQEFKFSNLDYLFFSKHIDWQSEREKRLLFFSTSYKNEFVSIKKSLKRIILGIDFNNVYLPSIIKLSNGVTIEKINFSNGNLKSFQFKSEYLENMMKTIPRAKTEIKR